MINLGEHHFAVRTSMSGELPDFVENAVNTISTLEGGRISEELAHKHEIWSRHAWNKRGRKVKDDAVARYIVEPCKWLTDGKRSPRRPYTGFTLDQTEPKPKRKPKNTLPITIPEGLLRVSTIIEGLLITIVEGSWIAWCRTGIPVASSLGGGWARS